MNTVIVVKTGVNRIWLNYASVIKMQTNIKSEIILIDFAKQTGHTYCLPTEWRQISSTSFYITMCTLNRKINLNSIE